MMLTDLQLDEPRFPKCKLEPETAPQKPAYGPYVLLQDDRHYVTRDAWPRM